MNRKLNRVFLLLRNARAKYRKNDTVRPAGTAVHAMVFAMAAIIIISISISGILPGRETTRKKMFVETGPLIGEKVTQYFHSPGNATWGRFPDQQAAGYLSALKIICAKRNATLALKSTDNQHKTPRKYICKT